MRQTRNLISVNPCSVCGSLAYAWTVDPDESMHRGSTGVRCQDDRCGHFLTLDPTVTANRVPGIPGETGWDRVFRQLRYAETEVIRRWNLVNAVKPETERKPLTLAQTREWAQFYIQSWLRIEYDEHVQNLDLGARIPVTLPQPLYKVKTPVREYEARSLDELHDMVWKHEGAPIFEPS